MHPAPWYIGMRRPPYFVEQKSGVKTEIVAVTPPAHRSPGVPVTVTLTQVQWMSVRRAEGNGFYTWDTERKEMPAGSWTVTTAADAGAARRAGSERWLLPARSDGARRRAAGSP